MNVAFEPADREALSRAESYLAGFRSGLVSHFIDGLAAYVWTGDVGRAHRIAQEVEAGMVWVNSENVRHLPTPFGGMKSSGIGRDGGDYSFDFYMETKNIAIAFADHKMPRIGA